MRKGTFISFEGQDGSGKSTQLRLLGKVLEDAGEKVLYVREPGGTQAGEKIRDLLQFSHTEVPLCAEAELLLFSASRAQLVREVIVPALARGCVVLADRFFDSTLAYQAARGLPKETLEAVTAVAVRDCFPDRTYLVDMDPEIARARLTRRVQQNLDLQPTAPEKVRFEEDGLAFAKLVRAQYNSLLEWHADRMRKIDGAREVEAIADEIQADALALVKPGKRKVAGTRA